MDFTESHMHFTFPDNECYRIEKSDVVVSGKSNIKACECVCLRSHALVLVEAKSSSPRKSEKLAEYVDAISQKFIDSLLLYHALCLGRHEETEANSLPDELKNWGKGGKIQLVLIIYGHEKSWLSPVLAALKTNPSLRHLLNLWNIPDSQVKVFNHDDALRHGLIDSFVPKEQE